VRSAVETLGRRRALRAAGLLHALAFGALAAAALVMLRPAATLPAWAWPAVGASLAVAGTLLYLEQRWAENVDLAFFKVNVFVGLSVLAMVLIARAAVGF
jgi:4-hydroxybenzoate polyprenyltransferase